LAIKGTHGNLSRQRTRGEFSAEKIENGEGKVFVLTIEKPAHLEPTKRATARFNLPASRQS
jgi:hypothetical protein